ncbi:MAG: GGDEF domain-containing protein [Rhodocyclaceae bacterium]|nr:GGDEF domain-containing protein [Rhodocyclaceae bacterium]
MEASRQTVAESAEPRGEAPAIAVADDPRILAYRDAIRAMREGHYGFGVDTGGDDALGALGNELRRLAGHLDWYFSHASKLQEITDNVVGGLLLNDVLERIFESFQTVIPYNRIGCALLSDDARSVRACWARADYDNLLLVDGFEAKIAGSSLGQIIATGQPRIINDLEAYLAEHPESQSTRLMVREGIRSNLTCPLVSGSKPIGFLFFSSVERYAYEGVHQGIYLRIAAQLSALIEKGRLYQQIVELNQRLTVEQEELQHLATRDALTGVLNRRGILDQLDGQFSRSLRDKGAIALILIDVDHFKDVNDRYGHAVGDSVLKEIAWRIDHDLRQYNHLGRIGGEEFLVVLGDADSSHGPAIAERLRQVVARRPVSCEGTEIPITISAGVVEAPNPEAIGDYETLVAIADQALYEAKNAGRNRVAHRLVG